jgi:carboxypeptidase Q
MKIIQLLAAAVAAAMIGLPAAAATPVDSAIVLRDRALADSGAYEIVESLTTEVGARPAGSVADARAVAWAIAKFKALGYDKVYTEAVAFPTWRRISESAEITSPAAHRLAISTLGGSVGTSPDGVRATVVEFPSLQALEAAQPDTVRGKIVFVSQRMERKQDGSGYFDVLPIRSRAASSAGQQGAVALLMRSLGTDSNRLPHTGSVNYSPDAPQVPAAALSAPDADLLTRLLRRAEPVQIDLRITVESSPSYVSHNVIGELTGRELPDEFVLIGAHLDSWDMGTGAIDDGFGVGVTMAAGKLIGALPQRPRRSIRVVLFANEEQGFYGALRYAARDAAELTRHRMAVESDWGGGRIIAIRSPYLHADLAAALDRTLSPLGVRTAAGGTPGPDIGFLAKQGMPWAQLEQDAGELFDYHHSANDTFDKVDRATINQNAAVYAAFAYLAAGAD